MSGVKGLFAANSPPGHAVSSLHTLGGPCPDSRTYTWKLFAPPRKAMPVGIFRPAAKTEALNPAGRSIDGGRVGLKNAGVVHAVRRSRRIPYYLRRGSSRAHKRQPKRSCTQEI